MKSFITQINLQVTQFKVFTSKRGKGVKIWSGRRDSNPRLQPWQGCALPLSYARITFF